MLLFQGDWALVTGASSGIGREFARALAKGGMHCALVARRKPRLAELAAELEREHGVRTMVIPVDLTRESGVDEVAAALSGAGIRLRLLVNNAGAGRWGPFIDTSLERYREILRLDVEAMVALCHRFMPDLASFPSSAVINVSSQAALQPVPYMAVYAASKAFVHSFSQALYEEWREKGIRVETLVPGPTVSEFDTLAGAYHCGMPQKRADPAEAVAAALRALGGEEPVVASVRGIWKQRLFAALAPSRLVLREVGRMFRPPAEARS